MLIRSSQNAHRYIEFRDNRICLIQTHEKDPTGLIRRLGQSLVVSILMVTAMAACLSGSTARAELPTGYQTVAGSSSVQTDGTTMTITASNRAIINYQSFNIGSGNTVNILSPLSLHRVTGGNPSQILGNLNATGKVFLVNPGGIFFGAGAQVNVQGLVASTLDIHNDDFLAGNYTFQRASGVQPGSITNLGHLNAADSIALLAGAVDNQGAINAPQINVAVGDQMRYQVNPDFTVDVTVDKALQQKVAGFQAAIQNSGSITGELIQMRAKLAQAFYETTVNNEGIIKAQGLTTGVNGQIIAVGESADGQAVVQNRGELNASGTTGGFIQLEGDTTLNRGQMLSTGSTGTGGTIHMLGNTVANLGNAYIDVSGLQGGGTFLMGGDYQGQNTRIRNALYNFNDPGTRIFANALQQGNGGKVILWADHKTVFQGGIEAKGGLLGGNGGFVETSGHNILQSLGTVDAGAVAGTAGQWLLDPNNITIQNGGSETNVSTSGVNPITYDSTNDNAIVTSGTIQTALNNGTDVTIQTASGGSNTQGGDITVDQATTISKTAGGDATLTLKANRSILFNGNSGSPISLSSSSNKLNLILNADTDQGSDGGIGGAIRLNYATINSNGGNIILGGGANPLTTTAIGTTANWDGVDIRYSTLSAGAGNISLRGTGISNAANGGQRGIYLGNGSQITTTSGTITAQGTGGNGTNSNYGIFMDGNGGHTTITTVDGAINVTGQGGNGSSDSNRGIFMVNGGQITATGNGTVTVQGTSGTGTNSNHGILLDGWNGLGSDTRISTVNGALQITGQANGTGNTSRGIYMVNGSLAGSSGSGTVTIQGTGGNGTNNNDGIMLDGWTTTTRIFGVDGNISVTGQGGNGTNDNNRGVYLYKGGQIVSTGNATITVNGTGGTGTNDNYGVYLNGNNDNSVNTIITSATGNIAVTGQGGTGSSNNNHGLYLGNNGQITSTGSANVTLTGIKGANTSSSLYTNSGSNVLGSNTMTGDLTLVADDYTLNNVQLRTGGALVYKPRTASTTIGLNGGAGTLQFGAAFLSLLDTSTVTPSKFVFGDSASGSGAVTIGNNWDLSAYNSSLEVYGGSVTNGSITVKGGRNLLLQALAGDININAGSSFNKTSGGDANFNLLASRSILLNGASGNGISISSSSNKLNVLLNADTDQGSDAGEGGAIKLDYTTINSNGGAITLGGGANALTTKTLGTTSNDDGISLTATSLTAGAGDINLRGTGRSIGATSNLNGIQLLTGSSLTTTSGNIVANGVGGGGDSLNNGLYIGSASYATTQTGNITLTGQGGNSTGNFNNGIYMETGGAISGTDTAALTLNGTGGAGAQGNVGIWLDSNSSVSNVNGSIGMTGQAGGSGTSFLNLGIFVNNSQISSTGTATMNLSGTGGAGTGDNYGVLFQGATSLLSTVDGNVTMTGQGGAGGPNNYGLYQALGGQIRSTGAGTLNLTGTGGNGTSGSSGIVLNGANSRITTNNATVTMNGEGGTGSADLNVGLYLYDQGQIISTGSGILNLSGTGGSGTNLNHGVVVQGTNSLISSNNGAVTVTGQGGTGTGTFNIGMFLLNDGKISSTGSATLNLSGTGGSGTDYSYGIYQDANGTVTSQTGDISVLGQGGTGSGNSHTGIYLHNQGVIASTGSADIAVTAIKGGNISQAMTSDTGSNVLGGNSMTGNLSLIADDMNLANLQIRTAGELLLKPYTASGTIGVNGGAGTLQLNSAFFNLLDTATVSPSKLTIGNAAAGTGAVTIGNNWNLSGYNFPVELYGGSIATENINMGANRLLMQARTGDLTIGAGSTLTSTATGNALVLAAGQNFLNNSGASALSASNGRWLVYSSSPLTTTEGGLTYTKRYNRTFAANSPSSITETGNVMLYSLAPSLTLTADNASKTYGAANPTFTGTLSGFIDGDTEAAAGMTGAGAYTTAATSASTPGAYGVTAAQGTLASTLGYQINAFSPGTLTVTKAPLTVKADNQSRQVGQSNPALPISYSGFVLGQNQSVLSGSASTSTTANASSPVGSYAIALNSTLGSSNYTINLQNGTLTVVPASSPTPAPSNDPVAASSVLNSHSIPYLLSTTQSPNTVSPANFIKTQIELSEFQSDRSVSHTTAAKPDNSLIDWQGSFNVMQPSDKEKLTLPDFKRIEDDHFHKNGHEKESSGD